MLATDGVTMKQQGSLSHPAHKHHSHGVTLVYTQILCSQLPQSSPLTCRLNSNFYHFQRWGIKFSSFPIILRPWQSYKNSMEMFHVSLLLNNVNKTFHCFVLDSISIRIIPNFTYFFFIKINYIFFIPNNLISSFSYNLSWLLHVSTLIGSAFRELHVLNRISHFLIFFFPIRFIVKRPRPPFIGYAFDIHGGPSHNTMRWGKFTGCPSHQSFLLVSSLCCFSSTSLLVYTVLPNLLPTSLITLHKTYYWFLKAFLSIIWIHQYHRFLLSIKITTAITCLPCLFALLWFK